MLCLWRLPPPPALVTCSSDGLEPQKGAPPSRHSEKAHLHRLRASEAKPNMRARGTALGPTLLRAGLGFGIQGLLASSCIPFLHMLSYMSYDVPSPTRSEACSSANRLLTCEQTRVRVRPPSRRQAAGACCRCFARPVLSSTSVAIVLWSGCVTTSLEGRARLSACKRPLGRAEGPNSRSTATASNAALRLAKVDKKSVQSSTCEKRFFSNSSFRGRDCLFARRGKGLFRGRRLRSLYRETLEGMKRPQPAAAALRLRRPL